MVMKGRKSNKKATVKQKSKRWKKGHSCVSNPASKKHRDAAKNRFFNVSSGPSGLTQEAVAKHDSAQTDDDGDVLFRDDLSDTRSTGGKSLSSSWASNWTECSNVTFSKVHRFWSGDSSQQKAVLAVLAAITEVIKSNDGKESDTEYFAALMTALEGEPDDEESLAAITYLLYIAMKRVPASVLKNKFSDVSKVLLKVLTDHVASDSSTLLRSTVLCLGQLLRVQDQAVWTYSSSTNLYNALLSFVVNSKHKVRKAAHRAVIGVLRWSPFMSETSAPTHHPVASLTAKFCVEKIESCGGSGDTAVTLHILGFLQDVLLVLPPGGVKSVCETILKLMTLANLMVTTVSMRCLHKMFVGRPQTSSLSPDLNGQIITALYDYQPGENDAQLMSIWLVVMKEAHSNLRHTSPELFIGHLPRFFSTAVLCLRSPHLKTATATKNALTALLKDDISAVINQSESSDKSDLRDKLKRCFQKVVKSMEGALGYQFHNNWGVVLEIYASCFEALGRKYPGLQIMSLLTMSELRNSHNFPHKFVLDKAVGMAVRTMSPANVLKAIPLKISGESDSYDFPNSWVLPVLRENIRNTELAFFVQFFLPLAAKLRTKSLQHAQDGNTVEYKTYDAIQLQIWSLLPGFCTGPTDLAESFKSLAKILGVALTDREDIRLDVLASIRKLITHNLDDDKNRAELARFSKNYLPLLFNLFTTQPEREKDARRLAVLETVKVYAQITDSKLIASYIDMCHKKGSEKDISLFRRYALLDILVTLVPYAESESLNQIFPTIVAQLKSPDRTVQKKSYRVLEEICGSTRAPCVIFVSSHLDQLQNHLVTALSSSSPSAKAPRLRCLVHIFKQLDHGEMSFVEKVIPEAVLCTKEVAEKARNAAFLLLIEVANAMFRWNAQTPKAAQVQVYVEMICAGLAGKPDMVLCSMLSLGRIVHDFKDYVSDQLIGELVETCCLLLTSDSREIVKGALILVKVLITTFDDLTIGQFVERIVSGLVSMKKDKQHCHRAKTKDIFTRLVRKYGYSAIANTVPSTHTKLLAHINKMHERAKRKKLQKNQADEDSDNAGDEEGSMDTTAAKTKPESFEEFLADSDSDMSLDEDSGKGAKSRKQKAGSKRKQPGATWLRETAAEGEAIVDFLDKSVSKNVMATNPKSSVKPSARKEEEFKTAPDGRLIISADSDEEGEGKEKAKDKVALDDLDELFDAWDGPGKKGKKRKMSMDEDNEEEEDNKYKAGGSGIHRPLKTAPGSEYKAKKAGGDIKKAGKHDPFAYIRLETSSLNKRKKAKISGQFKGFVKGAKKGAQKGQKLRAKKKK